MSTVQVLLHDRSYAIRVMPGALDQLGAALRKESGAERAVVLTTRTVAALHGAKLGAALAGAGLEVESIELADGERAKTLATAARIYDRLEALDVDRATPIVAFGGGALCDLAGFVASTYLRGLPVVRVPTTLRAQIDGSVGGRTALNHRAARNRLGTLYTPLFVWVDPQLLATLPPRELRAGFAEIVKAALVADADFFDWLEANAARVLARDPGALAQAIRRACEIKAAVVAEDEREQGRRAVLNLGHSFGHAIEAGAGYGRVLHGEAVAAGMVLAADLSARLGRLPGADAQRLRELLARSGLPVDPPRLGRAKMLELMGMDKKVAGGRLRLVLLDAIGRPAVTADYPQEALETLLEERAGA